MQEKPSLQQLTYPLKVLGRIDTWTRRMCGDVHRDTMPVPQCPHLLKRFCHLDRCLRQARELAQEPDTVAVDADMP